MINETYMNDGGDYISLTGVRVCAKSFCRVHPPSKRILFPANMTKSVNNHDPQGKAKSYVSDNHTGYNSILHNINYRLN